VTGSPGRPPRRGGLTVLLEAKEPARRRELAALLAEAGHAAAHAAAAPWDAALVDLVPGEEPPAIAGGPLVLLADHVEPETASSEAVSVLPRNAPARQVEAAVAAAAAGLVVRLPDAGVAPGPPPGFARDEPGAPLLTPREVEILALVGEGASNKAVARRLGISAHTVKFHLEAVFRKLGATTRAEAVARGLRQRLIEM
jgi:two-component system, NarL family, nitrate/nitrite response regulator NarL